MMILKNKNTISVIYLIGMIVLYVAARLFINTTLEENCIKKGGKAVEDTFGNYEKCIYGNN